MRRASLFFFALLEATGCGSPPAPPPRALPPPVFGAAHGACAGVKDCAVGCHTKSLGAACYELGLIELAKAMPASSDAASLARAARAPTVRATFARAATLLDQECKDDTPISCALLGELALSGWGIPADHARAIGALTRACAENVVDACTRVGWVFQHGVSVSPDVDRAVGFFEQACDGGHGSACEALAEIYASRKDTSTSN